MARGTQTLLLGAVVVTLSAGLAAGFGWLVVPRGAANSELNQRLANLALAAEAGQERTAALELRLIQQGETLQALEARLSQVADERLVTRRALAEEPRDEPVADAPQAAPSPAVEAATQREFQELMATVLSSDFGMSGSLDEQERFWELTRDTTVLADLIDGLQAKVAADPGDLERRLALADAYVAKLLTVPIGPERGIWGQRAENEWRAVLEAEPSSWEAQFKLSNSLSYYPPFLGRQEEALEGLSQARALQEGRPPEVEHVETYLSQSRVFLQLGQQDNARDALQAGLRRHPGNSALEAALERIQP